MNLSVAAVRRIGRARGKEFLRFCIVGGIGFFVDSGVLLAAVHFVGMDPIAARFLSFALAVWATFELNRSWAFRSREPGGRLSSFVRYLGVQGFGFFCNFGMYAALYLYMPAPYNAPLLCLAVASGIALIVNYAGASLLVFRSPASRERARRKDLRAEHMM